MIEGRNTSPVFDAEFTPMQQMDEDNDFIHNDDLMYSLIRKNKSSNQLDDGRQLFQGYDLFNDFLNKPQSHH